MLYKIVLAFGVLLAALVGVAVIYVIHYRIEESREVHFVVPLGYRGVLVTRAKKGAPPVPLVHGSYIVTFPKSGVLDVASNGVFYQQHNNYPANYDNGAPLTEGNPIPDMKPNGSPAVEFFDMGTGPNDTCYWFVGTHDDFIKMVGKNHRDFLTDAQKKVLASGGK
jgi:hypothetical protein